jgi:hypothetical protein
MRKSGHELEGRIRPELDGGIGPGLEGKSSNGWRRRSGGVGVEVGVGVRARRSGRACLGIVVHFVILVHVVVFVEERVGQETLMGGARGEERRQRRP